MSRLPAANGPGPVPDRHVVIGTAGHVDHGKTALVEALTGVDTDRWEEEKRRGITIDLGFARLPLDGIEASVVDVPGHEDFVRNMVAGATGIDLALLVVAADEGVMPQTREHLSILEFLGIPVGVVAVTKSDLAEPEWLDLVLEDVRDHTSRSGGTVAWEDPIPVSSRTGEGLDRLRETLGRVAAGAASGDATDLFRMPIDRAFSVAGAGTVVTGTTWSGTVCTGAEVRVLPADRQGRVRSIEVHSRSTECAAPGRRTALALVGVDREAATRGNFVVADPGWTASRRIDVEVTLLPDGRPLTQRSRVRFHLGTAEVMARVTPAAGDIPPGGTGVVRLRLEDPLVCRWGDRGILRSYSPVTTVGGCVVVDPAPEPRPRRPSADPDRRSPDPVRRVAALVRSRGTRGLLVADLPVRMGIHPESLDEFRRALAAADVVGEGDLLLSGEVVRTANRAVLEAVTRFHETDPLRPGLPLEAFRRAAGSPALADRVRRDLEAAGEIEVHHGAVRLAGRTERLDGVHAEYADRLRKALRDAGRQGLVAADLEGKVPESGFRAVGEFLVRQGEVTRVGNDRYFLTESLKEAAAAALRCVAEAGEATPAELRDALGVSRKYLIPLLEWMDAQGITVRAGDVRRAGHRAADWA